MNRNKPKFCNSSFTEVKPVYNHGAEQLVDPEKCKKWVTTLKWKMGMSFTQLMDILIPESKIGRRHGYVRLYLYPTLKEYKENGNKCFAIFIRKRDIYVVGVESVEKKIFEIGRHVPSETLRYFFGSTTTGFGQQYSEFFRGTGRFGDLVGVWVGFHVLNEAILRVIRMAADPFQWAWSVGIFALTFGESIRFVWYSDVVSYLINNRTDIRMIHQHKYLAKLPKEWTPISQCARKGPGPNDHTKPQTQAQKHTMAGLQELKEVSIYAIDSLHMYSWDSTRPHGDFDQDVSTAEGGRKGQGLGRGREGHGFGDGEAAAY